MPLADEPYYCSEQIKIPPEYPDILKQFTKAAIRTQPKDVLQWSHDYFLAMSTGAVPPAKDRLEMPVATQKTDTQLTFGLLRTLHRQLGPKRFVSLSEIEKKWKELELPMELFHEICRLGNIVDDTEWVHFLALASSSIRSNLTESLKLLCELLTADPDGGAARINFDLFTKLYKYLASIDGNISQDHIEQVLAHLAYDVTRQHGMIQPNDFMHRECPPLQPQASLETDN